MPVSNKSRGSGGSVLYNARSRIDAHTVRTHTTNAHTCKTKVKSIQCTTKCNDLTKLLANVDDDKKIEY